MKTGIPDMADFFDADMDVAQLRLLAHQLDTPLCETPHDAVQWMGMMQAQDYRMMRWAVSMRTKAPSLDGFVTDYNSGRIVRTHLMRMTWQLVAGEDLMWMLQLCRSRNWSILKSWMAQNHRRMPEPKECMRIVDHIRTMMTKAAGQHGVSLTREDLFRLMAVSGLEGDSMQYSFYLRMAEIEGVVCSGELQPSRETFTLAEGHVPQQRVLEKEDALAELARRYFRSHGPATIDDFAWWTGLKLTDCRKGMEALGDELVCEEICGFPLWRHRDCRTHGAADSYVLLPSFDEYIIGYKGSLNGKAQKKGTRQLVYDEAFREQVFTKNAIFPPLILHRGFVVGRWSAADGSCSFFYPEEEADLSDRLDRYRQAMK